MFTFETVYIGQYLEPADMIMHLTGVGLSVHSFWTRLENEGMVMACQIGLGG